MQGMRITSLEGKISQSIWNFLPKEKFAQGNSAPWKDTQTHKCSSHLHTMVRYLHIVSANHSVFFNYLWLTYDTAMQVFVILYYLGNKDKVKLIHVQNTNNLLLNIYHLWIVESRSVELTDTEGWFIFPDTGISIPIFIWTHVSCISIFYNTINLTLCIYIIIIFPFRSYMIWMKPTTYNLVLAKIEDVEVFKGGMADWECS